MSQRTRAALSEVRHRPWPLNERPWAGAQTWHELLFAHWPLPPAALLAHVPAPLQLETFDGSAWLSVVSLRISGARPRGMPPIPGTSRALELNVRTYVRYAGKSGVLFLSLDSTNLTHVVGARAMLLPYFPASISMRRNDGVLAFSSQRRRPPGHAAAFHATFSPEGPVFNAEPGSLDHFLTERYALYTASTRSLMRLDIQHPPWTLQRARGELFDVSVVEADGVAMPGAQPLLHFAARQEVVMWLPQRVAERAAERSPAAAASA